MRIAALAASLLATATLAAADARPVRIFMYSEYIDPALAETFAKKTGYTLDVQVYEAQEDMIAKLQTGGTDQYDVVVASDTIVKQMIGLKLVQPLDQAKITRKANVDPLFLNPPFDQGNRYSYPYFWGTTGLFYDTAKVKGEATWKWVLDPAAQPGPFVLMDEARTTIGCTLRALGFAMNSTAPAEVKAAADALVAAKRSPKCLGFAGGVAARDKVVGGEAVVGMVFNGDAAKAIAEKPTLAYAIPAEGSNIWVDVLMVTAKAPNPDGAHALIDFLLDADAAAQNANFIHYATPVAAAKPKLIPAELANPVIYPAPEVMKRLFYLEDLGKATKLWDAAWTSAKSQ